MKAAGGADLAAPIWCGLTTVIDSPFISDHAGAYFDTRLLDQKSFDYFVQMTMAGLTGELVYYGAKVPEASSLDEVALAQAACQNRNHVTAKHVFAELSHRTWLTLRQYASAAPALIAALERKDVLEGPELADCLSALRS